MDDHTGIMKNSEIKDPLFREAVEAIDSGDITVLKDLLAKHPNLIQDRLDYPIEGYFKNPYLLWFVADNPIRIDKLPSNIVEITQLLVEAVKRKASGGLQEQLDYTMGLVATGRIPKECGVQLQMIDLLIDAGAKPGNGIGALAHGNIDAAAHLIEHGGKLTLTAAVCLERMDDVVRLAPAASQEELLLALTAAGFYGKWRMVSFLLNMGVNPNGFPENDSGFHSHATPLHQAVCSGSLYAVKLLVEAGADTDVKDRTYQGTPLGWAAHMQTDEGHDDDKNKFKEIEAYLSNF
ncbi:MAG: ankyrin repeat protein [Mucilaginibacter sp.]|nr:ankyrin repeat protein [Mucilaginibacter sp.]